MLADALDPVDVSGRARVGLAEVVDNAAALHRVDRKYLVDRATAAALLEALPASYRVLEVAGRTSTGYRSTYFDTPDLATARAHVQKRRRRWKVRSRLYVEDGLCRIEVKTKDGRGSTVKTVADAEDYGLLDAEFVRSALLAQGIEDDLSTLGPTMEVRYRRTTLADTEAHERVTLDHGVRCTLGGDRVWLDDDCVLVETKSGLRLSPADRVLHGLGVRPQSFSKYVSAATLLRDDLPDNDVRRLHGRLLHSARLSEEKVPA
jgi:hypothetical protein